MDLRTFAKRAIPDPHYKSYNLGDIARRMGAREKIDMPDINSSIHQGKLREYNINNCLVVLNIWKLSGCEHTIPVYMHEHKSAT